MLASHGGLRLQLHRDRVQLRFGQEHALLGLARPHDLLRKRPRVEARFVPSSWDDNRRLGARDRERERESERERERERDTCRERERERERGLGVSKSAFSPTRSVPSDEISLFGAADACARLNLGEDLARVEAAGFAEFLALDDRFLLGLLDLADLTPHVAHLLRELAAPLLHLDLGIDRLL